MESPGASADDRLSGWKEVAQYLKRGVRTAQRWEKELGLPVHRLKTKNGQVLYARRSELDAWMTDHAASLAAPDADEDQGADSESLEVDSAVIEGSTSSGPTSSRWLAIAVVSLVAICGVWFYSLAPAAVPATIRVSPLKIEAISESGNVVWEYALAREAVYRPVQELMAISNIDQGGRVDLTNDGIPEFLVPLRFQLLGQLGAVSDALMALDSHGQLLWSLQPDDVKLTFGGVTYEGPWQVLTAHVSADAKDRRVWVSYGHHTWWPSFVLEVTADGGQVMRHVQPGWVTSLSEWTFNGTRVLAAGGVLNEPSRSSVTLIDLNQPLTVMPAESEKYRFSAPAAPPMAALTFPLLEVPSAQQQEYTMIRPMRRVGERLRLDIGSFAHVFLDPDGGVTEFSFTDLYRKEHVTLGAARVIHHPLDLCPEPAQVKDIRTWTAATGWRATPFVPLPASTRPLP